MMGAVAQPDARQGFNRLFLIGHAVKILRQHHVLDRSEKGNEVKLLEDESNFLGAHTVQVSRGDTGHVLTVEPDFARRRAIKATDQIHQRRFTRPRRAHDGEPFAARNVQRDVVERMNRAVLLSLAVRALISRGLGGVEFGHVFDLNHFTLPAG